MENSENLSFMYGQNFKIFSKSVWIAAGMHQKSQNLLRLPIWPQKKSKFVWINLRNGKEKVEILIPSNTQIDSESVYYHTREYLLECQQLLFPDLVR